ncbi:MAG: sulfatase [Verrucomicrobiota bacterium]
MKRLLLAFVVALGAWYCAPASAASKPNVLFIAVDDLNDWVKHLGGHPQGASPNIDKLAKRGVTFANAHCASPVCNPSRAALMSGMRSSTTGVYSNSIDWRKYITSEQTLNQTFRNAGYWVGGSGKIYHGSFPRLGDWDDYMQDRGANPKPAAGQPGGVGGITFAPVDAKDEDLDDYRITDWAINQLQRKHDKPFFLACGLHKPHMPWYVPRKYYDMFPADKIVLPKVLETDLDDVPTGGKKMAKPDGDHATMLKSGRWKEAVQGYLAAIAYTDMNIGRLMAAFDKSAYKDNTIIVFWGDHGWHLGEKQHWRKFTLWEEATRAPLMWVVPGVTKPGGVCNRPVDFMSIFPTLTDLCGIPTPKHVEGVSIRPLLGNPNAQWSHAALTTHGRNNHGVRTEQWRYIRYDDGGEELYNELTDPMEWANLANDPKYADVKKELAKSFPKTNVPTPGADRNDGEAPKKANKKKKDK